MIKKYKPYGWEEMHDFENDFENRELVKGGEWVKYKDYQDDIEVLEMDISYYKKIVETYSNKEESLKREVIFWEEKYKELQDEVKEKKHKQEITDERERQDYLIRIWGKENDSKI